MINIIVAYDKNRLIGSKGKIPWKISEDMEFFRNQTMGHPVIMGRNTWESIPRQKRPLEGRLNAIITRRHFPEMMTFLSLEYAISCLRECSNETYLIGGRSIYEDALRLDLVDRIYASEIQAEYQGDVFFPEIDDQWESEVIRRHSNFNIIEYKRLR